MDIENFDKRYKKIAEKLEKYNCQITSSYEEIKANWDNTIYMENTKGRDITKVNVSFIASCGHSHTVSNENIKPNIAGKIVCKDCNDKYRSDTTTQYKNKEKYIVKIYEEIKYSFSSLDCILETSIDDIKNQWDTKNNINQVRICFMMPCKHKQILNYSECKSCFQDESVICKECGYLFKRNKTVYNISYKDYEDIRDKVQTKNINMTNSFENLNTQEVEFQDKLRIEFTCLAEREENRHTHKMFYGNIKAMINPFICPECDSINENGKDRLHKNRKNVPLEEKYDEICMIFEKKDCVIQNNFTDIEEQYKKTRKIDHVKINYIAKCGHKNFGRFIDFKNKSIGINCKNCNFKKTRNILREKGKHFAKNNEYSQSMFCEYTAYTFLKNILEKEFIVCKCVDGSLADFMIKHNKSDHDLYQPIQLKSTEKMYNERYSFELKRKNYQNAFILCYCINKDYVWLFQANELSHLTKLNIPENSKYNRHKVMIDDLNTKLRNLMYEKPELQRTEEEINIPVSVHSQQKQKYVNMRTNYFTNIPFVKPEYENGACDFSILGRKFQESVAGKHTYNSPAYSVHVSKSGGRINGQVTKIPREKGKSDFYWIHILDTTLFYIFPEEELDSHGFLSDTEENKKGKKRIYLHPETDKEKWYNKYIFDYKNDKIENEKRIMYMIQEKK